MFRGEGKKRKRETEGAISKGEEVSKQKMKQGKSKRKNKKTDI